MVVFLFKSFLSHDVEIMIGFESIQFVKAHMVDINSKTKISLSYEH